MTFSHSIAAAAGNSLIPAPFAQRLLMWFIPTRWVLVAWLLSADRTLHRLQFSPLKRLVVSSVIASLALLTVQRLAIPPSTAYEGISRTPSVVAIGTFVASKLPRLTLAVLEQLAASSRVMAAFTPSTSASALRPFARRANRIHSTLLRFRRSPLLILLLAIHSPSVLLLLTALIFLAVLLSILMRSPFIPPALFPLRSRWRS